MHQSKLLFTNTAGEKKRAIEMQNWRTIIFLGLVALGVFAYSESRSPNRSTLQTELTTNKNVPSLAAIGGAQAESGDLIRYGDRTFSLEGVNCPSPSEEAGRDAKALANTFIKIDGRMQCDIHSIGGGWVGDCVANTSDGPRRLSQVMKNSRYCS